METEQQRIIIVIVFFGIFLLIFPDWKYICCGRAVGRESIEWGSESLIDVESQMSI